MPFEEKDIRKLITVNSEDEHIEFKEAKTQFDSETLFRYCVALANEDGGLLILGVTNKQPRAIVGTKAYLNLAKI
jgi:ATP-dependent DNA helicase RecG